MRIGDDFHLTPLTSYGTQKAIGELLPDDYTRRGFVDGVGIRLPTICVRPGKPNEAASGFFSNIIREPLNGARGGAAGRRRRASPAGVAAFGGRQPRARRRHSTATLLGDRRCLTMPGLSVTVAEQIAALREVAGDARRRR